MHRSRIALFVIAAATAAVFVAAVDRATQVVDRLHCTWRIVSDWAQAFGRWVIGRMPKVKPTWWASWRRAVATKASPNLMSTAYRRPLVSTRWRMCPST